MMWKLSTLPRQTFLILLFLFSCAPEDEVFTCDGSLSIEIIELLDAVDGEPIGKITVDATGGRSPYLFSIDGVNFQSSGTFTNLSSKSYTVTVADANDCTSQETLFVKVQSIVSYTNDIVPIISTNCTIGGCHCSGNSLCFSTYENVKANAIGIKDRTEKRSMPPSYSGKILTENQITAISNWVYQGAKNN